MAPSHVDALRHAFDDLENFCGERLSAVIDDLDLWLRRKLPDQGIYSCTKGNDFALLSSRQDPEPPEKQRDR